MCGSFYIVLFIGISLTSGDVKSNESWIHDSLLEALIQPDDVDSGLYDNLFLNDATDANDVIKRHSLFQENDYICARQCNGIPRICYYHFKIEHYSAMGDGCGNCTCATEQCTDVNHCRNPHCIAADGYHRNMISVNRRYPGPPIYVCKGDRVVVDVTNMLQGKAVTLHWHGIFQKGRPWMDGVTMLSQCPVIPATTFRYDFIADEPGTHYWHDHTGLVKLDGVQGPLIVREPELDSPYQFFYDYDLPSHTMFLTDWKHFMSDEEFPDMKPFPGKRVEALLINGKGLFRGEQSNDRSYYGGDEMCLRSPLSTFEVRQGFSYRFRIIGAYCMMCAIELQIQDHFITVIAVDGNPIDPVSVQSLVITSGERYDIVVRAHRHIDYYWIHTRGISPCEGTSQAALLKYVGASSRRSCFKPLSSNRFMNHPDMTVGWPWNIKITDCMNTFNVPPKIINPLTKSIYSFVISSYVYTAKDFIEGSPPLFFKPFQNSGPFRSTINNISSTVPSYPLYTQYDQVPREQFCSEECVNGTSKEQCKPCVHLIKIPYGETVDFIIADPGRYTGIVHPFHLHGHKFYVLDQGMMGGDVSVESLKMKLDSGRIRPIRPPLKDTIVVPLGAYAIIRFFTDNPGIWIFHCHYIYHNAVGMHVFLQVGQPKDFPKPPRNFPTCGNYQPPI